ncbi:hypothetical protein TVAG_475670 [Trichomonas vaginalis G3]|uniref:Uncharacterized protein n=1 Tax=Trichomonas vaginalis (strain ATCC PRA-98 / G3) TaxID=412133 RepID=A2D9Z1_TRIV3|nr:Transcription initiation factor IID, 18kD subunit family [Trichomonas vaginalis G3]EAY22639.1 hypothetical protein TVAG_475670 [Trichomonas vaginalis G3]KAI5525453.1 Transcription initiation factor IID, 18kD subunit family [Trichomonas vaginalis G3]|eukprot:XP_001583625.1 hypothetical protein [Trichomonas vaginalis G3]
MPPKNALREAVTQIMYTCSGNKEQYNETVDTVLGALQVYLTQLTKTALQNSQSAGKISADDIMSALKSDRRKYYFLQTIHDKKAKTAAPTHPDQ